MRSLIFSTLFAMVLTLTGVITLAYGEQDKDAQKSIEQNKNPNVDVQEESGDMQAQEYIVKEGDTLAEIAEKFLGTQEKWQEIARANHLDNPDRLEVGDRLLIPDASEIKKDEFNQESNTDSLDDTPDTGSKSNQMDDSPEL